MIAPAATATTTRTRHRRLDIWDAHAVQRRIYELAGFDPSAPVNMAVLANALGLPVHICEPVLLAQLGLEEAPFPGDGALSGLRGDEASWRIFIRGGISRERRRFALAHEIAEWALRDEANPRIEEACDAIAAALLAPGGAS